MRRLAPVVLGLSLGAACLAGCSNDGDVEMFWHFTNPSGDEAAADGCGRHWVDSIFVTGASDKGDGASFIALCTAGSLRRSVPAATWTFSLHTLDVHGKPIQPLDAPVATTDPMPVSTDNLTPFPSIGIPPVCADGVDNDGDGLVDLDDPDCGNDPSWTSEALPNPNPLPPAPLPPAP